MQVLILCLTYRRTAWPPQSNLCTVTLNTRRRSHDSAPSRHPPRSHQHLLLKRLQTTPTTTSTTLKSGPLWAMTLTSTSRDACEIELPPRATTWPRVSSNEAVIIPITRKGSRHISFILTLEFPYLMIDGKEPP